MNKETPTEEWEKEFDAEINKMLEAGQGFLEGTWEQNNIKNFIRRLFATYARPTNEKNVKTFRESLKRICEMSGMGVCPGCGLTPEGLDFIITSHDAELRRKIGGMPRRADGFVYPEDVLALLSTKK